MSVNERPSRQLFQLRTTFTLLNLFNSNLGGPGKGFYETKNSHSFPS